MSRKYRQSGYQDDDRGARERRGGPSRPRDPLGVPRGRGLGKPTATVMRCAVCGSEQNPAEIELESTCGECGKDLHTCTNCTSFDSGARFQCRQPIAQPIPSKARRNTCELFAPRQTQEQGRQSDRPDDARAAFDALFDI